MIRLLQWLFLGHVHKWVTVADAPLRETWPKAGAWNGVTVGTRLIQQCEHCGSVVKRDLI